VVAVSFSLQEKSFLSTFPCRKSLSYQLFLAGKVFLINFSLQEKSFLSTFPCRKSLQDNFSYQPPVKNVIHCDLTVDVPKSISWLSAWKCVDVALNSPSTKIWHQDLHSRCYRMLILNERVPRGNLHSMVRVIWDQRSVDGKSIRYLLPASPKEEVCPIPTPQRIHIH
jgi:hypothetical protein